MKTWKKAVSLMIVSSLTAFALVGCGSSDSKKSDPAPSNGGDKAAVSSATLDAIKKRDKLVVGVKYDTNLFGLKDPGTGEVQGFDIDIAKELAKTLVGDEKKLELKEVTSKTRIPMLDKGDIDLIIATMTITDERKKQVNFSDIYYKAGQSLLVKKGSDVKSVDDLKGKKVLTAKGSTSAQNIRKKAPDAEVLEFDNYADAFTALKAGKGDALTTDNTILLGMSLQDPNYVLTGGLFTDEPYGIAIKKDDQGMTDTVNKFLKDIKANGKYNEIYKKWFKEDPKN